MTYIYLIQAHVNLQGAEGVKGSADGRPKPEDDNHGGGGSRGGISPKGIASQRLNY